MQRRVTARDSAIAVSGCLCLCLSLAATVFAPHPDGPPLARTGGFGEPTCQQCHEGDALNVPGGTLRLEGLPGRYQPGREYQFTVVLRRAGMQRAGFEAALRLPDGSQAGTLVAADTGRTRVQRDSSRGVQYAHHLRPGTAVAGDSARWTLRWTAPTSREGVQIHVAALAANDDNSPLGDFVYAAAAVLRAR